MNDKRPIYDRELLLHGAKRRGVLDLWEVQRYGLDSDGDIDYVSIDGMRPADWHAKGARILGRTAVECTRDGLGDAIGRNVATIVTVQSRTSRALVVGRFAGSGNTLDWLLRHPPDARGVGFITEIVDSLLHSFSQSRLLCAIQVYETGLPASMAELRVRFDRSTLRVYELNAPGQNHGILLGTKGWAA